MKASSLLRLSGSLVLAAVLMACGGDDGGGGSGDEPAVKSKKDAGIPIKDSGTRKTSTESAKEDEEEEEDEEETSSEEEEVEEEAISCNVHTQCPKGPKGEVACCDWPTHTCFNVEEPECPILSPTGTSQPAYN